MLCFGPSSMLFVDLLSSGQTCIVGSAQVQMALLIAACYSCRTSSCKCQLRHRQTYMQVALITCLANTCGIHLSAPPIVQLGIPKLHPSLYSHTIVTQSYAPCGCFTTCIPTAQYCASSSSLLAQMLQRTSNSKKQPSCIQYIPRGSPLAAPLPAQAANDNVT